MPNKHGADQMLVAFALDLDLASALDKARKQTGENRSAFIRKSIVDELRGRGMAVPEAIDRAPDRVKYPARRASGAELNDRVGKKRKK